MSPTLAELRGPWSGWIEAPVPGFGGTDEWVDLSHPITEDLSRSPAFPQPEFRKIEELPADPANVTHISMAVHHGTHVDAPSHFFADGPTIDQVPLERLYGAGVLYRVDVAEAGTIDIAHLLASAEEPRRGDIVLIDTGRHRVIGTPEYADAPSLGVEAALWLADRGVKLVGIDASTPDLPAHRRGPGFDWPVHQILLREGILIAEHMANLSALRPGRIEAFFGVTPFVGADAGPARVIGRNLP